MMNKILVIVFLHIITYIHNLNNTSFNRLILDWYYHHKRNLPWRNTKKPYLIWISEIILQQTRVKQGLPYYEHFIKKYPTIEDLAAATEMEVLRTWQGLGYYSRARNMHRCAKLVVEKYMGVFPDNYDEILALPGIGPYTAAAISSICFNKTTPVIDGNVFRVLSRIFGIKTEIQSAIGKKDFEKLAKKLISSTNPGDYNQAIMEFGALHCTPNNPDCTQCVFSDACYANQKGMQLDLPVKKVKNKAKNRYFVYYVMVCGEKIFFKKRVDSDIWNGLFEFYLIETPNAKKENSLLEKFLNTQIGNHAKKTTKHILTHQVIFAEFHKIHISESEVNIRDILENEGSFYTLDEMKLLPKPVLINNYLKEEFF